MNAVLAAALSLALAAVPAQDVFSKRIFTKAWAEAQEAGKDFVVFATKAADADGQRMVNQSWKDANVVGWVADHAVVVKLDPAADVEQAKALGFSGGVDIVLFREGAEVARSTGFRDAASLLAWLRDPASAPATKAAGKGKAGKTVPATKEAPAKKQAAADAKKKEPAGARPPAKQPAEPKAAPPKPETPAGEVKTKPKAEPPVKTDAPPKANDPAVRKAAADKKEQEAAAPPPPAEPDPDAGLGVFERQSRAERALGTGDYAAALPHYLAVWKAEMSAGVPAVRGEKLRTQIGALVAKHPPAKKAFKDILADLERRLAAGESADTRVWNDIGELGQALEPKESFVRVFDRLDGGTWAAAPVPAWMRHRVYDGLVAGERRADAGRVYASLQERIDAELKTYATGVQLAERNTKAAESAKQKEAATRTVRGGLAELYGCALAAGRTADADAVATALLAEIDDAQARIDLVKAALVSGQQGPQLATWLDEAEGLGGDVKNLRSRLSGSGGTPGGG